MKILPRECVRVFPKICQSHTQIWICRSRMYSLNRTTHTLRMYKLWWADSRDLYRRSDERTFQTKKKRKKKTKLSNWIDLLTFVQSRSLFARTWFEYKCRMDRMARKQKQSWLYYSIILLHNMYWSLSSGKVEILGFSMSQCDAKYYLAFVESDIWDNWMFNLFSLQQFIFILIVFAWCLDAA